ncbi:MAG: type IV pilus modification PilV family protein [Candidatus Binatia bacterium]
MYSYHPMQIKQLKSSAGFTLVEILVALTIFTFAVLGLAVGTVTISRTNNNSHLNAAAINLAQAKLEELRAMKNTTFTALSCPNYSTSGCSDTQAASGFTYTRSWMITANSPAAGMNKIDVKIDWKDYTNQSLTFSSSVAQ